MPEIKSKPWYARKEFWGAALTTASGGLTLFAPHTVAYKVGVVLGIGLTAFGLRKGYQANNLPTGIASKMDKIPNMITGIRGSYVGRNNTNN